MAEEILESQGIDGSQQQDQQVPEPPKKLSVKDFAAKIKAKYPTYSSVDDNELVSKMLDKYPTYKDQVESPIVKKKETTGEPSKTGVQTDESGIPTVSLSPSPSQKTSQPSVQPSQESNSVWEQSSLNPMSTIKGMTQQPAAPTIPEQIQPVAQAKPKPKVKPKVVERPSITDNANKIDWYNASEAPAGKVEEPKAILGDFNRAVEEQVQYGKTAEAPKDFTAVDFTKHLFNKMIDATNSMPAAAADMVAASIATQMPNPIQAQQFLHDFRTNIYPSIRDFHKKIELNVPKAKEEEFNNSFLSNVVTGIGEMVPAMALPMGSGFLLQAYDNGVNSINQSEEGKNLPEVAKTIFGAASASTLGLLMKLNIDKIFGKDLSKAATSIATKTLNKMLQESEAPITMEAFEKALIPEVTSLKDKIVSNGGKILNSGIHSSLFGTAMAATDDLSKAIVNKATGKKVFDEKSYELPADLGKVFDPNSWGNGWKDIATTSASMGAQGLLLGGVAIPRTQESNYIKEAVTNAKSAEDIAKLKNDINEGLGNGTLAPEDAKRVSDLVDKYVAINSKIPAGTPNRSDVVDKVEQKDDLKNQATQIIDQTKTVDDAFHPQMLKEAEALMNRANEVNGEITGVSSEPVKQSMYLDPLELPELKQQIADINDRISKGGADGEVAKQELATIKEDPIKFYEDRKQNARENLTPETNLNEVLANYDSIINKLKENDKENKSRLSGEVGVGEEPVKTKPVEGGGAQETSGGGVLQAQGTEGEGKGVEPKVGEVTDTEYNNFIDKGAVSDERINDIAEKIKNKEDLSDREKEIFTDKTADINKILKEKQQAELLKQKEVGEEVVPELKDVESTAKALEVGEKDLKKQKELAPKIKEIKNVYFHGTNNNDIKFDENTVFYGSKDEKFADTYGEKIIPTVIELKNPYDLSKSVDGKILDENGNPYKDENGVEYSYSYIDNKVKSKLKERGYDGILMDGDVVAFDKNQVKTLSEAYHEAKADGSNPDLVKAVEDLIGKKTEAELPKQKEVGEEVKEENKKTFFHGGRLDSEGDIFLTPSKEIAKEYASINEGKVKSFSLDENKIMKEDEVRDIIKEMNLSNKEGETDFEDLLLHELLDPRIDTSFSKEDINKIKEEVKKRGYDAISYTDEDITGKSKFGTESIIVINKDAIQPTRKKAGGAVQATTGVPEQQGFKEGVQPSTEPISGGGTETTTTVLKGKEPKLFSQASVNRVEAKKAYAHVNSMDVPTDANGLAKHWLASGGKVGVESFADEVM
jgi:hypothetical protein